VHKYDSCIRSSKNAWLNQVSLHLHGRRIKKTEDTWLVLVLCCVSLCLISKTSQKSNVTFIAEDLCYKLRSELSVGLIYGVCNQNSLFYAKLKRINVS
jgi:hypothetical protein